MGQFLVLPSRRIIPSQDFLKEDTVGHILRCYFNNMESKLPPSPFVRRYGKDYIAIDGHNLLAINQLMGKETMVYVANSSDDGLVDATNNNPGLIQRNLDLANKFDTVLFDVKRLDKEGIRSFTDLLAKYDFLRNIESAKKYYKIE
ncbi:MAG TPA: hypothetical protein VJI68_02900 [Candidatus Nanoarchaeia archaeon]|nr:hypothetical protein [Candidatus Nanoarchaeia archaeon]